MAIEMPTEANTGDRIDFRSLLYAASTHPRPDTSFPFGKPTSEAWTIKAEAESILREDWIRSQFELVPKGTIARLARDYKARLASRPYKKTSDLAQYYLWYNGNSPHDGI